MDFYPRPPRGGRPHKRGYCGAMKEFLSTPSARRATSGEYTMFSIEGISIHALREEGDFVRFVRNVRIVHFYPRPPRGGRQGLPRDGLPPRKFLSTPSARRATRTATRRSATQKISIHALREEGDRRFEQRRRNLQRFLSTPSARRATCCCHPAFEVHTISIHALREEGDS